MANKAKKFVLAFDRVVFVAGVRVALVFLYITSVAFPPTCTVANEFVNDKFSVFTSSSIDTRPGFALVSIDRAIFA